MGLGKAERVRHPERHYGRRSGRLRGVDRLAGRRHRMMTLAVQPIMDRASATDLAFLSMDRGAVPEQFAALLVFTNWAFDLSHAEALLAERVAAVPRLRQRLVPSPPGCGRPIWVDDADFDIRRHVREIRCLSPGDEGALLDTAITVIMERLSRSRPLWSAVFITGLADDAVALVLVVHHVLADGIGGLAVLASLADPPDGQPVAEQPVRPFPARRPSAGRLAVDALRGRLRAVAHAPAAWRDLRRSMAAGGGVAPARVVSCSLTRPTGPRRRLAVVYADLATLRAAAHRSGGTVNDAVLVAVAGALHRLLAGRGERVDAFAVAIPVAGRRAASAAHLGNQVAPLLVAVSGLGDPGERLAQVAAAVRAGKASAAGPPPIAILGSLFRAAAALGGFRWYMRHQHRLHTLVTHVRGPDQPLTFAGATVKAIIPVSVGEAGNATVSFTVLSYAGTLTITAVADPDHVPDLPTLTRALQAELASIARPRDPGQGRVRWGREFDGR